jgi:hypothetical protein
VVVPTGTTVTGPDIDVLSLREDRVTAIWMLAGELQRLAQVGALPRRSQGRRARARALDTGDG